MKDNPQWLRVRLYDGSWREKENRGGKRRAVEGNEAVKGNVGPASNVANRASRRRR